jgi:DNA-binding MarR family transcriptional regulator
VCTALRTLARQVTAIYELHLREAGLTISQYGMLARLDRLGCCSLSELAEITDLDITSASRSAAALITKDLVAVSDGKDARTKSYRLSPNGKRILRNGYTLWQRAQQRVKELIPASRLKTMLISAKDVSIQVRSK